MRVGLERKADRGVPQHLLDDTRMQALTQEQRRTGVSEVVEPDRWEPAFSSSGLKCRLTMFWASSGVPLAVAK